MRATKMFATAVLVLSGLVAASQTSAQGFYIGGSVGKSDMDEANAIPALITSGSVDGKDTGYKIFGAYQFNRNFGLELAYVDLGKASYSGTFFGADVTGGSVEVTGFNFSAVGTLPVNSSFALFGKLGIYASESKASDVTGGVPFSVKDENAKESFGLGVSYNITKNVSARAEWERLKAASDIDLLSIGVVFKF